MTEHCEIWEPLPHAMCRYMILNVVYLERIALEGAPLSLIIASSDGDHAPDDATSSPRAWRVSFTWARAFRCIAIGHWEGPKPYSDERRHILSTATWEVVNSRWLATAIPTNDAPHHPHKLPARHFVIASSYDIYDIAAAGWEVAQLGAWTPVLHDLKNRWIAGHPELPPPGRRGQLRE